VRPSGQKKTYPKAPAETGDRQSETHQYFEFAKHGNLLVKKRKDRAATENLLRLRFVFRVKIGKIVPEPSLRIRDGLAASQYQHGLSGGRKIDPAPLQLMQN
jgi:hypothetical protein